MWLAPHRRHNHVVPHSLTLSWTSPFRVFSDSTSRFSSPGSMNITKAYKYLTMLPARCSGSTSILHRTSWCQCVPNSIWLCIFSVIHLHIFPCNVLCWKSPIDIRFRTLPNTLSFRVHAKHIQNSNWAQHTDYFPKGKCIVPSRRGTHGAI